MAKLAQSMRKSCVLRIDISVLFMEHIAPYRFTLSLIPAKINLLRIDYSSSSNFAYSVCACSLPYADPRHM